VLYLLYVNSYRRTFQVYSFERTPVDRKYTIPIDLTLDRIER